MDSADEKIRQLAMLDAEISALSDTLMEIKENVDNLRQQQNQLLAFKKVTDEITKKISIRCLVCLKNKIKTAFFPCSHAICCYECSTKINKCPKCRANIIRKITIYLG